MSLTPEGQWEDHVSSGDLVSRALTPGDSLYERGREVVLISGSLAQSRFGFKIVRRELEPLGLYRWSFSTTGVGAKDPESGVELRVLSRRIRRRRSVWWESRSRSWTSPARYAAAGRVKSSGMPFQHLLESRAQSFESCLSGRLRHSRAGWWRELVEGGSTGSTYVQLLQGDVKKWDDLREVYRVNPLARIDATVPGEAATRTRCCSCVTAKAQSSFSQSYRTEPTQRRTRAKSLLTVDDWERGLCSTCS